MIFKIRAFNVDESGKWFAEIENGWGEVLYSTPSYATRAEAIKKAKDNIGKYTNSTRINDASSSDSVKSPSAQPRQYHP